jgi:hypothetical protein
MKKYIIFLIALFIFSKSLVKAQKIENNFEKVKIENFKNLN